MIAQVLQFTVLGLFLLVTSAQAQTFSAEDGYAEFESTAPAQTFKGVSNNLNGLLNFDSMKVDFFLDLNTLKTGIRLRDKHMRESYLETHKYPFAEFTGTFVFDEAGTSAAKATGVFTVHGKSKALSIQGTLTPEATHMRLKATFDIVLEDFAIDRPKVAFYQLNEIQKISIDILLKRNTP